MNKIELTCAVVEAKPGEFVVGIAVTGLANKRHADKIAKWLGKIITDNVADIGGTLDTMPKHKGEA